MVHSHLYQKNSPNSFFFFFHNNNNNKKPKKKNTDDDKNGKIERNEIKLISSEGGEGSAVRSAFTNAKKTIFKCQKKWDGFNLQDFDYAQWQQIVLTFNPDQMRNR